MCEYCKDEKPIKTLKVGTFGTHNVQFLDIKIQGKELKSIYRNEYFDIGDRKDTSSAEIGDSTKISFCPMCGRKLENENATTEQ